MPHATGVTMDAEDSYFSKFYPNFYKVYSCEKEVAEKFMNNARYFIEKYSKRKYSKIYILDSIAPIVPENIPHGTTICGMISIDNLDGTGHWVAFRGNRRSMDVYDSIGMNTPYDDQVTFILKKKFPEIYNITFCLQHYGPQPLGGVIPDEDKIMKWALENEKPLPPWEHSIITGYQSQHQFCYLEAYLWLVDRQRRVYTMNPRENLEWIKRQAAFMGPPNDFFYVYDPETDERCEIPPF